MRVQSVVAVVDQVDQTPVVWWVDIGVANPVMSRLGGAWVLDTDELRTRLVDLVAGRLAVTTASGAALLRAAGVAPVGYVDLAAMPGALTAERDRLQLAFEAEAARPGKKNLVEPSWPRIPAPLDVEHAHAPAGDARASRTLAIANHLAGLCHAWDALEDQRLARRYLRELGGEQSRPLPMTLLTSPAAHDQAVSVPQRT